LTHVVQSNEQTGPANAGFMPLPLIINPFWIGAQLSMRQLVTMASCLLLFWHIAPAQEPTNGTRVICRDATVPDGFVVVEETTSDDCPDKAAVIIRRRRVPTMTSDEVIGGTPRQEAPPARSAADPGREHAKPSGASVAIDFAKKALKALVEQDPAAEQMIDWEDLKFSDQDFGAMVKQAAGEAGIAEFRKQFLAGFPDLFRKSYGTSVSALMNWRIASERPTVVDVDTPNFTTIHLLLSVKRGKPLISGLDETKR
jgi:hypothetical protein